MQTLESLKGIFKDRIFKIPDYQRGYAWQIKQLKDFWEDIINLPIDKFHYTGLLSLKEISKNEYSSDKWTEERWLIIDQGYKGYHIVDGQQRLTTFIIFINEIISFIRNLPENLGKEDCNVYIGTFSLKSIKEEYLVIQKPPLFIANAYKFGYETDNPSFKYLRHKIFGESNGGNITETFYTLNLENAKQFFKSNLINYYNEYGLEEVEGLFKKVTQNLMFNLHEIEDDFDVFVAFETMNNRGKRLSNLELLKNRLIYLTTLYDKNELDEDSRKILRKDINDGWKEIYYHLGKNKKSPLSDDEFLVAHWIMYFQYKREKGDDYIRFLLDKKFTPQNIFTKNKISLSNLEKVSEIKDNEDNSEENENLTEEIIVKKAKLSPNEISDYVKSLKSSVVHWYNAFNPLTAENLTQDEKLWLDRLNRVGIAYFRPLVMASFSNMNISSEDRIKLFKEIERFIFIAFRLGRAMSTYGNSEYYRLSKKLYYNEITVNEICESIKNRVESWISPETNFDIQPFKTYISKHYKNGGGFYWWNGLHYFLYEYEHYKFSQSGNEKIDWNMFVKSEKDKVSIEHIYPQTATNKYWTTMFKGYNKEQKKFLNGSLGNLLPLSMSKNSSMQNQSFLDKKNSTEKLYKGYVDGSHSEIEVALYNNWGAGEILDRGINLLNFMEKRWNIRFNSEDSKKELLFLDFM